MKYFCVSPWYNKEIIFQDVDRFCCWATKSAVRSEVQLKMINNELPSECVKCQHAEARGELSQREQENVFLDYMLDTDIKRIEENVINGDVDPITFQIKLNNICNGACVTCGTENSSTWVKLEKVGIINKISNEQIAKIINFSTVKSIKLLGGEPFLSDTTYWILGELVKHNNTNCFVSLITNGTIKLPKKQLGLLSKFALLNICVSIDAVGKEFEYIRYPLSWDSVKNNLLELANVCSDISVSYTASNLNINQQPSIIDWLNENKLSHNINYVTKPAYFAPDVQPGHELWPAFVAEIARQDKLKGIHIKDYLPYVWDQITKDATT